MNKAWEQKVGQLSDKTLAALFMRVRRELEIRKQARLANQEESMFRSQVTEAEVSYLNLLFDLPDTREQK